jgi:nucleotide-binding universal stress UspA family protein
MFTTILVPLDGSSRAEAALPLAARIARHTGAVLLLVRVVSFAAESWSAIMTSNPLLAEAVVETDLAEATEYLERVAASPTLTGTSAQTAVYHGPAASTILEAAASSRSDLIVLCRHGATGLTPWAMGSTAAKVVRHTTIPVLVVPDNFSYLGSSSADLAQPLRMLIPLDGSIMAQAALEPGAALLRRRPKRRPHWLPGRGQSGRCPRRSRTCAPPQQWRFGWPAQSGAKSSRYTARPGAMPELPL